MRKGSVEAKKSVESSTNEMKKRANIKGLQESDMEQPTRRASAPFKSELCRFQKGSDRKGGATDIVNWRDCSVKKFLMFKIHCQERPGSDRL